MKKVRLLLGRTGSGKSYRAAQEIISLIDNNNIITKENKAINTVMFNNILKKAKFNNITNINFYCEDSTKFINELAANKIKVDCVILDPPRTGTTYNFINAISKMGIKRVVYVSCGPETLARDLKIFKDCCNINKKGNKENIPRDGTPLGRGSTAL